jgi:hypothetical protein
MHAYLFQVGNATIHAVDVVSPLPVIDLDGNDSISPSEFTIGMDKLMVPLHPERIKKACAIVAGLHAEHAGAEARRLAGICTRART